MRKIIVAIDGYSGCGKSTTAKAVAKRLQYAYVDSGAMYRAVTLYVHQHQIAVADIQAVAAALPAIHITFQYDPETGNNETYLNGQNAEAEIRKMYISEQVSAVSAIPDVRRAMVQLQQKAGRNRGIVMDGRDIGTRVFADAELKIFMTADMPVRARRRQQELLAKGQTVPLEEIVDNLQTRDHLDTTRAESPLRQAEDAYVLDTTNRTFDDQVDFVINLASHLIRSQASQPFRDRNSPA